MIEILFHLMQWSLVVNFIYFSVTQTNSSVG